MPILNKLEYLDETKQQIKNALNTNFNSQITDNDTFRSYVDKINNIYTNWPKVQVEGSNINLNNTKKARLGLELKGDSSQETTNGENLQKFNIRSATTIGIKYNCEVNGQITVIGTATAETNLAINQTGNEIALESGSYVLKVIGDLGNVNKLQIKTSNSENFYTLNNDNEFSFTLNENKDIRVLINIVQGVTYNSNFYVTLAKDNATNERYTGGMPSPSPDYPSEIKIVEGLQNIKIQNDDVSAQEQNYLLAFGSKNVLDFNNITVGRLGNNGTVTVDGDNIIFESTGQSVYGIEIDLKDLNLKTNAKYTLSTLYENTDSFGGTNGWRYYNGTSYTVLSGAKNYFNFTTGDGTTNKLYFYLGSPTTYNGVLRLYNIQLLEETVLPSDIPSYLPYIANPVKLAGIGDYKDFIFKNEIGSPYYNENLVLNSWYKKKKVNIVNSFNSISFDDVEQGMTIKLNSSLLDGNNKMPILSTNQKNKNISSLSDEWGTYNGSIITNLYPSANLHAFYINKIFNSASEAKRWFISLNPTLVYPIDPVDELITNTLLIEQLNNLDNANSYDNTTIITSDGDLPVIVKASALMKGGV